MAQQGLPSSQSKDSISIQHKLPILIGAVLLAILSVSVMVTYGVLGRAGEVRARERLLSAGREVAGTATQAMSERFASMARIAAQPAISAFLRNPNPSARDFMQVRAALQPLMEVNPTGDHAMEVWDATGRPLFDAAPKKGPRHGRPRVSSSNDTPFNSPLVASGQHAFSWFVAPVKHDDAVIGFVAAQIRVGGRRDALRALREFTGDPVNLYTRNNDGSVWVIAPNQLTAAPTRRVQSSLGPSDYRPRSGRNIVVEIPVENTPFLTVLEVPASVIYARNRATVLSLAGFSLALLLIGAALCWVIARRIARPLVSFARAAEDIAKGNYARRVQVRSHDEIGRLAESLNKMAAEIEAGRLELQRRMEDSDRASRAKSEFLAVMSHELRTPLNAIGGYAELLEMGVHGPVTDAQRDALLRIERNQAHLLSLINDILNFSKLDAGRVHYTIEPVALNDALAELEMLIAPQVRAKDIIFAYRPGPADLAVKADRDKLQQIVLNLLSNAVKFTPTGGNILVESESNENTVLIHVRDTGVGIPEDRLQVIFDPFVQVDRARNRPVEGVGLGLAISRDLARGMNGELSVESALGVGSTFTITLPRAFVTTLQPA